LPGYPGVIAKVGKADPLHAFDDLFGGPARILSAHAAGLDLLVLDAPHLYARPDGPYSDPQGRDWADNPQRFAALCWAAAEIGRGALPGWRPDVVHAHDWQAGLVPAYLHYGGTPRPGTVFTVHNLAFQGQCDRSLLAALRLPPEAWGLDGVEYYGAIGTLKAGLRLSDRITTVSPTYAREITTPAEGMGLDGLLRARAGVLHGILNGIDEAAWNPAADPHLTASFDAEHPEGREANRAALRTRMGLEDAPEALVIGVVTRLTGQKGMDLLLEALPALLGHGMRLALLGAGEPALEAGFLAAAAAHPGRIGVRIGYDEALAHLIQGGCDALLVPSRFEPCGLTQLCALRYGALPVVARVGGLADTVIDANEAALATKVATGLQFAPTTAPALESALARLAALWQDRATWAATQANALHAPVGWARSAARYAAVYRELSGAG
jgi:starch synthase